MTNNNLSASLEDYLEVIFHIVQEKQAARARDITRCLQVNNSSVTGALRSLSEKGFVNYAPYDLITLTQKGEKLAKNIVRRHKTLKKFFIKILCADEDEAEFTACKMEHAISSDILERLTYFLEFTEICPKIYEQVIDGIWCNHRKKSLDDCEKCIYTCLEKVRQAKNKAKEMHI